MPVCTVNDRNQLVSVTPDSGILNQRNLNQPCNLLSSGAISYNHHRGSESTLQRVLWSDFDDGDTMNHSLPTQPQHCDSPALSILPCAAPEPYAAAKPVAAAKFVAHSLAEFRRWNLAILVFLFVHSSANGDFIRLKSGGEVRGEIVESQSSGPQSTQTVTIRTLTGGEITIDKSDIDATFRRRLANEIYQWKRRAAPDTVDGQLELADWCRTQNLSTERARHYKRVIELEPDNLLARRALGHTLKGQVWMSPEEIMLSRGFVRHKGKWVLPQEVALIEQDARETAAAKVWHKKIRAWVGWIHGSKPERSAEAVRNLQMITDPDAIPGLVKNLCNHVDVQTRLLYISTLAQIDDERIVPPLINQSVSDVSVDVRHLALRSISEKYLDDSVKLLISGLGHRDNLMVNRSAEALDLLDRRDAIPALIEALNTEHKYKVTVPIRRSQTPGTSVNAAGGFATSQPFGGLPPDVAAGLMTGQYTGVIIDNSQVDPFVGKKTYNITRNEDNPSVRKALKRLTEQDFGYNKATWRAWFQQNKVVTTRPATP